MKLRKRKIAQRDWWVDKIVSGGQTGVDRAALDVAIALGIPHAGWCPRGRLSEDGPIPDCYLLTEHESDKYSDRTKQNIIDSEGTLILHLDELQGGSLLTYKFAMQMQRPCLKIKLGRSARVDRMKDWLVKNQIRTVNIAGPRGSKEPMIYTRAYEFLIACFDQ